MQGNCVNANEAAGLILTDLLTLPPPLSIKHLQCVVVVADSMMQFLSGQQWLDNIYFRVQRHAVDPEFHLFELGWASPRNITDRIEEVPSAQVYMTNVTVQGQRIGQMSVLTSRRGAQTLAKGACCVLTVP